MILLAYLLTYVLVCWFTVLVLVLNVGLQSLAFAHKDAPSRPWCQNTLPVIQLAQGWYKMTYAKTTRQPRLQRWRSDMFVARVRHTSLTFVFQLRLLLDMPSYALLVTVNLSCRRQGLKHLAVTVSALLPPPFGTFFLIISVKVTLVEDASRLKTWLYSCA